MSVKTAINQQLRQLMESSSHKSRVSTVFLPTAFCEVVVGAGCQSLHQFKHQKLQLKVWPSPTEKPPKSRSQHNHLAKAVIPLHPRESYRFRLTADNTKPVWGCGRHPSKQPIANKPQNLRPKPPEQPSTQEPVKEGKW